MSNYDRLKEEATTEAYDVIEKLLVDKYEQPLAGLGNNQLRYKIIMYLLGGLFDNGAAASEFKTQAATSNQKQETSNTKP